MIRILSRLLLAVLVVASWDSQALAQLVERVRKIVIIAGRKSHGPVGNGIHDYGWSAKLLKTMLENSNIKEKIRVEIHTDGWPKNDKTLEDADAIMIISDGRDGALYDEAPHLASEERVRMVDRLMKRGCGFVTFHFSTFAPEKYREKILDWSGGYFQWETDGKRQWYSAITTAEADVLPASPTHPVSRGVTPFRMREEFYYNLRFKPDDPKWTPIWTVPSLKGREPDGRIVAWAREREDGGRGFGTSAGHFYDNWEYASFRTMILNALAWTARVEIPAAGVSSRYFPRAEVRRRLGEKDDAVPESTNSRPIRAVVVSGNEAHRWHNWPKTTPAIKRLLEVDTRMQVEVVDGFDALGRNPLGEVDVIVLNYCNWHDPIGANPAAKKAFLEYVERGGGVAAVHFANGAFHFSLPMGGGSDWPAYRSIIRRVWNHHGKGDEQSGHDPFGAFTVHPTDAKHPITEGLKSFEVIDELYFRQAGSEPITPLIVARSRVTKRDEPLAFAYTHGKARIFQTLLGHSEKTYESFEAREILRRGVAWAAGRQTQPRTTDRKPPPPEAKASEPLVDAKFGKGFKTSGWGAFAAGKPAFREPPLTVDCWAKLDQNVGYNILVSHELKSSATHWELFSEVGSGNFTVYLPGFSPDHVRSGVNICDGAWRHVSMVLENDRVRLYVDGKLKADQKVKFSGRKTVPGNLGLGVLAGRELGCTGVIDEVRIRKGVIPPGDSNHAAVPDAITLGLWRFEVVDHGVFLDDSPLKNHAKLEPFSPGIAPNKPLVVPPGVHFSPTDPKLKAVLIDRSENDAYLAVRLDGEGRLFVGGRDSVFRFDPDPRAGFGQRREILKFPKDSIIMGLEVRGDDLWVLTANALYIVPNGRVKTEGLQPRRMLWGVPLDLHVSFHCLAWGPDGDLYVNHGDPLLNHGLSDRPDHWGHWTLYVGEKNTPVRYTGTGAVLRMKPDGSKLEVMATGLRGPVGLTFDSEWNLFTNDNDHESRADLYAPARQLWVAPGIDFAWPRGWMASKSPDRSDLVEPVNSEMGRGVPCDSIFYDDPYLPEFRGKVLLQRWDRMATTSFAIGEKAAFFAPEITTVEGKNLARPVGIATGRDGRVFATALYLAGNVWSPYCPSDVFAITRANDNPAMPFEAIEWTTIPPEKLWNELGSDSWERRRAGHLEIVRRGKPMLDDAPRRLKASASNVRALSHLVWLTALSGDPNVVPQLTEIARNRTDAAGRQAARALLHQRHVPIPANTIAEFLKHADATVVAEALAYLRHRPEPSLLPIVWEAANSSDPYRRQLAARFLAEFAPPEELMRAASIPEPSRAQLAAVLAVGMRLTIPKVHGEPPGQTPLEYASGNAHFKLRFADSPSEIDLKKLAPVGSYTTAVRWKSARKAPQDEPLFQSLMAALESPSPKVRSQAGYYLSLLRDPRSEDRLKDLWHRREFEHQPATTIAEAWALGPVPADAALLAGAGPEKGLIDLTRPFSWKGVDHAWRRRSTIGTNGAGVEFVMFRLVSLGTARAALTLPAGSHVQTWIDGRSVSAVTFPAGSSNGKKTVAIARLVLQPGGNDILVRLPSDRTVPLSLRAPASVTVSLPDALDGKLLAERLMQADKSGEKVALEFVGLDWPTEAAKGDPVKGRKLFGTLGCAKCHGIVAGQAGAGAPSLADARKRFQVHHVVESVLLPNRQVAEPFRATRVVTSQGLTFVGLVVAESSEQIELLLTDTTRRFIRISEIESRTHLETSAMPAGLVRTPSELRDLLSYILSDNPAPP